MRLLFIFLDGIGLGSHDPETNPLVYSPMPNFTSLLENHRLTAIAPLPLVTKRATLLSLDAKLGVGGLPQSATGQAALLTGANIAAKIGYHYGPKPNQEIIACLKNGNLFSTLKKSGMHTALLNAYPPRYFDGIERGHRLHGTIALAAYQAGLPLMTETDLYSGTAVSADFTGQGWRDHLGYTDTPLLTSYQAGQRLAGLSTHYDLAMFEYWLSDVVGHHQEMLQACRLLETLDNVLGGLLDSWDNENGLVLMVSDHGNLEDLSTRRHTLNPVPLLLIGAPHLREQFIAGMRVETENNHDLTSICPAIIKMLVPNIKE